MSSDFVAAIDLGSNSFHMIVARIANGQVQVLDRLREMVQLAAGLDGHNRLSDQAQQRALDCLARFGQRLRHIPTARVRIVGTNTLRQARNSAQFVARAEQVLEMCIRDRFCILPTTACVATTVASRRGCQKRARRVATRT